jgi:uncharacterized membrane protein
MTKMFDTQVDAVVVKLSGENAKSDATFQSQFTKEQRLTRRKAAEPLLKALVDRDGLIAEARSLGLNAIRVKYHLCAAFLDELLELAMAEYESQHVELACEILKAYRLLAAVDSITVSFEKQLTALWGSLACNVILQDWDTTAQIIFTIKEAIDSLMIGRYRKSTGFQVTALVHWITLPLFLAPNFSQELATLFLSEHLVSVVLATEPQLIPCLAAAVVASDRLEIVRGRALVIDLMRAAPEDHLVQLAYSIFFSVTPAAVQATWNLRKPIAGILLKFSEKLESIAFSRLFEILQKTQVSISQEEKLTYFASLEISTGKEAASEWLVNANEAVLESLS